MSKRNLDARDPSGTKKRALNLKLDDESLCRRCCKNNSEAGSFYCLVHKCSHEGCSKGIESRKLCKAHGGGKRCQYQGCDRPAQGGFNFCSNHGGKLKCSEDDCFQGRRDGTLYCIRHGGGTRCSIPKCLNGQADGSGLCRKHGGGQRCEFEGCKNGACTSKGERLCVSHGGGPRCEIYGCNSVAYMRSRKCRVHNINSTIKLCETVGCTRVVHTGMSCSRHCERQVCSRADCNTFQSKRSGLCAKHFAEKLAMTNEVIPDVNPSILSEDGLSSNSVFL